MGRDPLAIHVSRQNRELGNVVGVDCHTHAVCLKTLQEVKRGYGGKTVAKNSVKNYV